MRNLDECKAEIFRRSEEKIKKRKRINIILTSGISVAACAIIIACAVKWISTLSFVSNDLSNGGPQYSNGNSVLEDREPAAEDEMLDGNSNDKTSELVMGSLASVSIEYSAQYIRTNAIGEGITYPQVKIIRSVEELKAYYEANKDIYYLERRENYGSDYTRGFLDACDKYDEAYFENQILVIMVLEEGSGSISHKVTNVGVIGINEAKMMTIEIDRIIPEIGTCDMAEWHILIEPEAGTIVEDEEDIYVTLHDVQQSR